MLSKPGVVLSCAMALAACSQEDVKLPRGHEYFHISPSIAAIADAEQRIVVDPNVIEYAVIGDYVVGKRADAHLDREFSPRIGFFILDMRRRKLVEGLNPAEFQLALRQRKLAYSPDSPH
jgi:hypothetical protein